MSEQLKRDIAEDVYKQSIFILRVFIAVCTKHKVQIDDFIRNWMKIGEAALRTLRRSEFYEKYHTSCMSEIKLSAVLAFWILKYKPFSAKGINNCYVSQHINEYVAVNVMLINVLVTLRKNNSKRVLRISEEGYKQLIYRLKNWDLSKEGLMTLADVLYYYDGKKIDDLDTSFSQYGKI